MKGMKGTAASPEGGMYLCYAKGPLLPQPHFFLSFFSHHWATIFIYNSQCDCAPDDVGEWLCLMETGWSKKANFFVSLILSIQLCNVVESAPLLSRNVSFMSMLMSDPLHNTKFLY